MMNVARKLILISLGCIAWVGAQAQTNICLTSTKLACIVPYNSGTINDSPDAALPTATAAGIFSGPIGVQLSQLPLAASAPGTVILTTHGNSDLYYNLGPVLVDRPDTVAPKRFVLGFSAQQFNFNHLDGVGIGSIPLIFYQHSNTNPAAPNQYKAQTVHVSLKYNQYVILASYGLPKNTDLTVIVPFSRISVGVGSLSPQTYLADASNALTQIVPSTSPQQYTHGIATGPGDVVVNVKHELYGDEGKHGSVAAGVALRFPTGDALNYLGSGAYGLNLYGLAAYKARFSPHAKFGYQWNSNSVLMNVTGQNGKKHLPGGAQYALGADFAASHSLTISADLLETQFQNTPAISVAPFVFQPSGATILPAFPVQNSPSTVSSVSTTYTTANLSFGLKWKVYGSKRGELIVYGNVLNQLNDVGLRSDPSPSGGISYNFAGPKKMPDWLYRRPGHW